MNTIFIEKIKKEIEGFVPTHATEQVGTVVRTGDGIVEIEGLTQAVMSEIVFFDESEGKPLTETIKKGEPCLLYTSRCV